MKDTLEMFLVLSPYLVGLVPIVLARTWQARVPAIGFGLVSLGFGSYFIYATSQTPITPFAHVSIPVIGGLSTALISILVTFMIDRKHSAKA